MKMDVKKKFKNVINHVKSHPAIYGYLAGVAITGVAISVSQDYLLGKFLRDTPLIDVKSAIDQMTKTGVNGLTYAVDEATTILLTIAPDDFDPNNY